MNAVARCFLTFGLATALASVPLIASADDPQPPSPLPAGGCPLTGVEPFINFVLERTGVGSMELDCQGAQATPTPPPPPPTATPTPPPAATATPAPTATPTEAPGGASPTPPPTATASPSPTASPTATASPSPSPSPTVLQEERPAAAPRVSVQLAQLPSTSTGGGR